MSISDTAGGTHIQNLTVHNAPTEEIAQNIIFLGRSNRSVARTSMNLQSSRSHSVFTITLTSQAMGSEIITKSKVWHLHRKLDQW